MDTTYIEEWREQRNHYPDSTNLPVRMEVKDGYFVLVFKDESSVSFKSFDGINTSLQVALEMHYSSKEYQPG